MFFHNRAARWLSVAIIAALIVVAATALQTRRGLAQIDEVILPTVQDTDGDGVPDATDSDDDNDGMTDVYETERSRTSPVLVDSDGDQLSDTDEWISGYSEKPATNPNDGDTDDDGWTDGYEVGHGSNPNDPNSTPLPRKVRRQ